MTDRRSPDQPDFDRLGELLPAGTPTAARPGSSAAGGAAGSAADTSRGAHLSGALSSADDLSRRLAEVWADSVGAEVAENARPVQLRDGRLVVTTSSSAWAQTLQLMSPMIVEGLNERLGAGAVEKAVFRHAGWDVFASLDGRTAARRAVQKASAPKAAEPSLAAERAATGPPAAAAAEPSEASPLSPVLTATPGDLGGFSAEEKQALADLDRLPLAPATKERIRDAMKAGFARARQDSGRS